jgi:hypothetical protein
VPDGRLLDGPRRPPGELPRDCLKDAAFAAVVEFDGRVDAEPGREFRDRASYTHFTRGSAMPASITVQPAHMFVFRTFHRQPTTAPYPHLAASQSARSSMP